MKIRRLILLMPCIYLTKSVFGLLGSGFLMYKYSAICFRMPINPDIDKTKLFRFKKSVAPCSQPVTFSVDPRTFNIHPDLICDCWKNLYLLQPKFSFMKKLILTICTFGISFLATKSFAQDEAMMKKWMEFMTPGAMHKLVASFDGTWEGDISLWMDPAAPPTKSKGTAVNKMIYGGLYQESKHTGNFNGMPFEGTSILGFDNAKKKFVSTWIDNMGSGIMMIEGDYNPSTKTFSFTGHSTDPLTGKDITIRETLQVIDENTQLMKMYGPDQKTGKEYQTMEIKLKRQK